MRLATLDQPLRLPAICFRSLAPRSISITDTRVHLTPSRPAELAIRGIRSFDDKGVNIIQFFTPLTVIVGYNGSGKTTIIECLKYATTGDMPPNTKGGAFVHDPKMATSSEVKAQVRLRFYNANKVRMNCVRNLQVSVKKAGGLTLKTLEGVLQIDDPEKAKNKVSVVALQE